MHSTHIHFIQLDILSKWTKLASNLNLIAGYEYVIIIVFFKETKLFTRGHI